MPWGTASQEKYCDELWTSLNRAVLDHCCAVDLLRSKRCKTAFRECRRQADLVNMRIRHVLEAEGRLERMRAVREA